MQRQTGRCPRSMTVSTHHSHRGTGAADKSKPSSTWHASQVRPALFLRRWWGSHCFSCCSGSNWWRRSTSRDQWWAQQRCRRRSRYPRHQSWECCTLRRQMNLSMIPSSPTCLWDAKESFLNLEAQLIHRYSEWLRFFGSLALSSIVTRQSLPWEASSQFGGKIWSIDLVVWFSSRWYPWKWAK